jgi:hypothetical protein
MKWEGDLLGRLRVGLIFILLQLLLSYSDYSAFKACENNNNNNNNNIIMAITMY